MAPIPPKPADYAAGLGLVREAAELAGRPSDAVTAGLYVTVRLGDDPAQARAQLESYCQAYYGLPLEVVSLVQAFYAADAAGCADWLRDDADAGAREIVVRFGTLEDARSMAERFAADVLPLLSANAQAGRDVTPFA